MKRLHRNVQEKQPKAKLMVPGTNGRTNYTIKIILVAATLCQPLASQTNAQGHQANPQSPSYEVATIKPTDGNGFAFTLRMYILSAFGMQPRSSGRVIGPNWIDKKSYVIQGKPSDSVREAMSKMSREERLAESQLMMQSLLADRFKLKYHIEKRELPVYKLVLAKGGLKIKEPADAARVGVTMRGNGQFHEIRGMATIPDLIGLLTNNVPEIDGRPVVNATGLAATFYDFSLKWSTPGVADSASDATASAGSDAPSFFTAVQEELGLKLVAAKAPVDVVVIDHIEPPSEN